MAVAIDGYFCLLKELCVRLKQRVPRRTGSGAYAQVNAAMIVAVVCTGFSAVFSIYPLILSCRVIKVRDLAPVYVLGSSGMLGSTAVRYFESEGFDVRPVNVRFSSLSPWALTDTLNSMSPGIVINAIGAIPQRSPNEAQLLESNAVLPLHLAAHLAPHHILIHPSTDCVFAGDRGRPYEATDPSDARDAYGWTKRLGECAALARARTLTLRVSIIGGFGRHSGGLLAWLLAHPDGSRIPGYINHAWNGVTTLEWCRIVHEWLMDDRRVPPSFIQASSGDGISKCELLRLAAQSYARDFEIEQVVARESVDRRLVASVVRQSISAQLTDLAAFERGLNLSAS